MSDNGKKSAVPVGVQAMGQFRKRVAERVQRRALVAQMTAQCYPIEKIRQACAKLTGKPCSKNMVYRDRAYNNEQAIKQIGSDLARHKAEVAQGIMWTINRAAEGFARSQRDAEAHTEKTYLDEHGEPVIERTVTRKGQAGNSRFLEVVQGGYERIARLYGLEQLKVEHTVEDGYSAAVVRALVDLAEQTSQDGAMVIDGSYVKQHVANLESGNGNGEP
jgi:hypothetical protein